MWRVVIAVLASLAGVAAPTGDLLLPVEAATAGAGPAPATEVEEPWAGQIIVAPLGEAGKGRPAERWSLDTLAPGGSGRGPAVRVVRQLPTGALVLQVSEPRRVEEAMAALRRAGRFRYVQPNRVYRLAALPDDPGFPVQWGLHNTGQTILQRTGVPDVDVDAPEAWQVTRGSAAVTVAVIDTGVDLDHPDLAGAFWTNAAEAKGRAGVDDDGNGYVDDVHGFDFHHRDSTLFDPGDDETHGTHLAGILSARTGNGRGGAGLAPAVRLMVLKAFGHGGTATTAAVIEAIAYAEAMGARVVNMSWGAQAVDGDPALCEAIARSHLLFVAAAGNDGLPSDQALYYPAHCPAGNLIAVAAVDNRGHRASFSNYGPAVPVAAPGQDILSTWPAGRYAYMSGTSMAAPHVTGVAALAASRFPWLSASGLRQQVLASVKPLPALAGQVASGGVPSAARAVLMPPAASEPPGAPEFPPEPGPGESEPNIDPVPAPESPFADVDAGMALYGEILRAAELGLVDGYGDGRFRPDEPVTRQQFAKIMVRAYEGGSGRNLPTAPQAGPPPDYPDVDEGGGLGSYVARAAAAGWMRGYGDGFFRPDLHLSRLEAALVVARALKLPPAPHRFPDVRSRFDGQVGAVAAAGILRGVPAAGDPSVRLFHPEASLTRAQAAAVAVRVYDALKR